MRLGILFVFAVFASSPAVAADRLTWEMCTKEAAEKNAELIAAKEAVNKAEAGVSSSFSGFLPQVTGTLGYARGNNNREPASGAVLGGGGRIVDQYSLGVNATQNLFSGFQDQSKLSAARSTLKSSEAALNAQKAKLHQDLKTAFAQLLHAQETVTLSADIAKRRKHNFDLVELRFQGGRENKGAFLRSKASYREAQFEVSQGERELRVAQKRLARLLGRDLLVPIEIDGKLTTKTLPKDGLNFRELARANPSVVQTEADYKAAQEGVKTAYGAFFPSLALNGAYTKTGDTFPPDGNRWSVGATLTVPIFKWGDYAEVSRSKADELRAEALKRNMEEQTGVKLEESFANLRNAVEREDVQEETLTAAAVRSEISRSQYASGLISYNDWDIIENDLISQQLALLTAKRDAVIAEANWEQALGKGDIP